MFYCNDCHEYFESPKEVDEGCYEEYWGAKVWRSDMAEYCPLCESEDIEPASECGICKAPIKSSEDYCEECIKTANQFIDDLANQLEVVKSTAKDLLLAVMEKEK